MKPRRILLADDDAAVATLIETRLRGEGHEILRAATGPEAIEIAASRPFDAAVLDLHLPGANGIEVARAILAGAPRMPVALISGASTEATRETLAAELPGVTLLSKPVDWEALATALTPRPPGSPLPRLLLVEDHAPLARLLQETLAGLFDVAWHSDGDAALRAAHGGRFLLALVDLHVPGRHGPALVAGLREADPGLTVVAMTGEAGADEALAARQAGAEAFYAKPVSPADLLAQITEIAPVARRRRQEEDRRRAETRDERMERRSREAVHAWRSPAIRERIWTERAIALAAVLLLALAMGFWSVAAEPAGGVTYTASAPRPVVIVAGEPAQPQAFDLEQAARLAEALQARAASSASR